MYNTSNMTLASKPMLKCFGARESAGAFRRYDPRVRFLADEVGSKCLRGSTEQLESFGRVIPLLICGEQSAISVFGSAAGIPGERELGLLKREFSAIESEEAGHELLWQTLSQNLPIPPELTVLKRRAAIFFAKLGRADSIAEHFAQVSQLDSAVGTIMSCLERSDIAADRRVKEIAKHIKHDEARHVSVSRKLAFSLGIARERYEDLGTMIRHDLVELLTPIAGSIEGIGLDSDLMFRKIAKQR